MKITINKLAYTLIGFIVFLSCNSAKNYNDKTAAYEVVDSLVGDFDKNAALEVIKIKRHENHFIFTLYNEKGHLILASDKILYNEDDLGKREGFIYLSYNDSIITITQEFGAARPNGWYIAYVGYHNNDYIVDSISMLTKVWLKDSVDVESKSKVLNEKLRVLNLIDEFKKLQ